MSLLLYFRTSCQISLHHNDFFSHLLFCRLQSKMSSIWSYFDANLSSYLTYLRSMIQTAITTLTVCCDCPQTICRRIFQLFTFSTTELLLPRLTLYDRQHQSPCLRKNNQIMTPFSATTHQSDKRLMHLLTILHLCNPNRIKTKICTLLSIISQTITFCHLKLLL